jgi:hypothetical protein
MTRSRLAYIVVVASLLLAPSTFAGPPKSKAKPPPAPAVAAPAAPATPAPATASNDELKKQSTEDLMKKAKQLHDQLEYDQVLPLVTEVLSRGDAVPIDTQLDAYVLQGSCLAIIGNPIDAEAPFRRLLRGRPDFELPNDTPPKIMQVFRKVQAEEQAIARQMEELTRGRIVKQMQLLGAPPEKLKGGRSIAFDYLLKDPALAAKTVRVQYRKKGQPAYSSLALASAPGGHWKGEIPGEWTANDGGAQVEMYVETLDDKGPLLTLGSAQSPIVKDIAPGQVDRSAPPPLPPWSIWVGAGTTVALALAGAGFGAGMEAEQQAYSAQAQLATTVPQDGAQLAQKRDLGDTLAWTANGLFIASGAAALVTVVGGAFFTDWEGRADGEAAAK